MMGRMSRVFALLGVALWLAWSGEALAAARVALVVGNGDYAAEIGKLKNPASDAQLMADTLNGLGFEVSLVTDADQKAMKRAIREFGQKLRATGPNGIGLFYYAGHGVQVDGENFLLPIGAEIQAEGDVELEAVSASSILSQMQFAGNAVNLVFLDACRNNPLTRSFRSGSRGLARVDAPRGSFVGYSTAPGDVSVDGESNNSPYALALVEELNTPGISIEEAHRAVRGKVLAATNQRQTPWDSSSLTGPVVLKQVTMVAPVAPATPAPAPSEPAPATSSQQAELLFWDSIKNSDNPATFEAYLKQFPNGVFAGLAQRQDRRAGVGGERSRRDPERGAPDPAGRAGARAAARSARAARGRGHVRRLRRDQIRQRARRAGDRCQDRRQAGGRSGGRCDRPGRRRRMAARVGQGQDRLCQRQADGGERCRRGRGLERAEERAERGRRARASSPIIRAAISGPRPKRCSRSCRRRKPKKKAGDADCGSRRAGRAAAGRAGRDAAGGGDAGARRHHRAHRERLPEGHRALHRRTPQVHAASTASLRSTTTAAVSASASATRPAIGTAAAASTIRGSAPRRRRCRSAAAAAASSTRAPTRSARSRSNTIELVLTFRRS